MACPGGYGVAAVAALPDGRSVAVKIADGADRARVPVTAAALARAGVDPAALTEFAGQPLLGGGRPVGRVRPVRALDPVIPSVTHSPV
ncbi:asparaginase [Streptomyces sp. NBC_00076]